MNKSNKCALVTINIGDKFAPMAELTIPYMEAYAQKNGMEFVIIDKIKQKYSMDYSAYWTKFQIYDLLKDYQRILYLDLDTLVYPHCPNIFEIVPEDQFGALMENDYLDQTEEIQEFQTREKDIQWSRDYFNVGVMVISKVHKEIFSLEHGKEGGKKFPEQTRINYNAQLLKIPLFRLDYRYNHMYFCGELNHRDKSYIFHYAGINHAVRVLLIAEDIKRFKVQRPPVQLEEFGLFFEENFPGQDMTRTMMVYQLYKDQEIEK
jgi:lipopolysaccharide biosynthesis glycosyltransferase